MPEGGLLALPAQPEVDPISYPSIIAWATAYLSVEDAAGIASTSKETKEGIGDIRQHVGRTSLREMMAYYKRNPREL